jgi:hypothetical protein
MTKKRRDEVRELIDEVERRAAGIAPTQADIEGRPRPLFGWPFTTAELRALLDSDERLEKVREWAMAESVEDGDRDHLLVMSGFGQARDVVQAVLAAKDEACAQPCSQTSDQD